VIVPTLLSILKPLSTSCVLDAGCGTGELSIRLSELASEVVGVDPSQKSIEIASKLYSPKIKFFNETLELFSLTHAKHFNAVVANMVLMDVLSLVDFLAACRRVLVPGGVLAFSITHPCFWPDYYGYGSASWFRYENEVIVEGAFHISSDKTNTLVSTHVHRPLAGYFDAFARAGLEAVTLREPTPSGTVSPVYRSGWRFPRYIVGLCRAVP
jgi:predicted TPR repeat methyltransferase